MVIRLVRFCNIRLIKFPCFIRDMGELTNKFNHKAQNNIYIYICCGHLTNAGCFSANTNQRYGFNHGSKWCEMDFVRSHVPGTRFDWG